MFAVLILALVWVCVGVVPAFGAETRAYQSSFGLFAAPAEVAVNDANGDVYVIDTTEGTVARFDSTGAAKNFTAGPDAGTNTLHGPPFFFPGAQAVQVAVDKTSGLIYVTSFSDVDVYDQTGVQVATLNGASTPNGAYGGACGVAVDQSTGNVYVGDINDFTNGIVWRYTPSGGSIAETDYSGAVKAPMPVCNVAAAQGVVYAANSFETGEVRAFQDSDFATGTPPSPSSTVIGTGATTLYADSTNGDVYLDDGALIHVFDQTGTHLYDFGSGQFGSSAGVAVMPGAGIAYVADGAAGQIDVFGPQAALPPTAVTNPAGAIAHTTATLNGHLDPQGDPSIVDCHFEWGTDTSYGHTAPCAEGNDFASATDVHADITGLAPGQTYHFRLDITGSASGDVQGPDRSFTTTTFPVSTDPASTIHHTDVLLNGHFDPQSDPALNITACSFDWGTDTNYTGGSVPCTEGQTFNTATSVSALLNNLTPGTTYHYRLHLTTTGAGQITGQDQSVTPPLFEVASSQIAEFGPDGTPGSSFSPFNPFPLTFDQARRRLYAGDITVPGVYAFNASAPPDFPPIAGFSPLATGPTGVQDLAVDNTALPSAGNLYISDVRTSSPDFSTGKVFGFDSSGAALGGNFPIDPATSPGAPEGSPKLICGDTVDSAGDLWVANSQTGRILRYSASGVFLSAIDVSAQFPPPTPLPICELAFDSAGNLYVGELRGAVWRFTAASGYTAATQIQPASYEARATAVDPSTDDLYIANDVGSSPLPDTKKVTLYDPAGNLLATFASGIAGASFNGVAVDAASHDVYVADGGNRKIRAFSLHFQKPPTITSGNPTALTDTSATLNAKVDPEGFSVSDCHFEYGPTGAYGDSAPCVPGPGSGSGDVSVHADISALNGGSTYHFRIVAANAQAGGTATGPDQSFTTPGPAITNTRFTDVSDSAATLRASVNPRGRTTTYRFEYGTDSSYGQSAPVTPAAIGSGSSDVAVTEHISGLQPSTTYHFRLTAQSSDGVDRGPDGTFTTFATAPGFGPCPNDSLRTGSGASLPDCRAYEQVSPVDKHGTNIVGTLHFNQAAADGHAAVFGATDNLPSTGGTDDSPAYVASRGSGDWSYDSALPGTDGGYVAKDVPTELGRDEELNVSLAAVDSRSGSSLVATDLTGFSRRSLVPGVVGSHAGLDPQFADDTGHFIFEDTDALLPGAVAGMQNLYDYDHGSLSLAGMVPAFPATSCSGDACAAPTNGSFAGSYKTQDTGSLNESRENFKQDTISNDGSRVFFTEGGTGRLYERENGGSTIQISAAQDVTDANGHKPAAFLAATPDGHTVYFESCEKLTPNSTAVSTAANTCLTPSQGQDLYSYDTGAGDVTDLSVDPNASDPQRAGVQGMLGASPDGAYVYFVANGVLASGAAPGNCDSTSGKLTGDCSLYLSHAGAVTFIARLGATGSEVGVADSWNWVDQVGGVDSQRSSRVASDGTLLFSSTRPLTGYDNIGACLPVNTSGPCAELYRYDPAAGAGGGMLDCISCDPTGVAPLGSAQFGSDQKDGQGGLRGLPALGVLSRNLSADGKRVFFETPDKLVAADTNGDVGCAEHGLFNVANVKACQDVYEWEAEGSGSCQSAAQNGGCLYLLSTGTSKQPSFFDDASTSGNDVFIYTDSQLVPQDTDQLTDLYDVGVDGGMSSQHRLVSPSCTGDVCQGAPSVPPVLGTQGSETFSGPGNLTPSVGGVQGSEPKLLTRAQKLAKALKECRSKRDRHKRVACERGARKRYGPAKSKARKAGHSITTRKGGK
jgi:phosphodiesterase/alkaline phosphatase D-like protein